MTSAVPSPTVMDCGVYLISIDRSSDGKPPAYYVGKAQKIAKRWRQHVKSLRAGRHHSVRVLRAWEKYGEAAVTFRKLLVCEFEQTLFYEQLMLDVVTGECESDDQILNIQRECVDSRKGLTHDGETRARLREAQVENWRNEEYRERMIAKLREAGAKQRGKKHNCKPLTDEERKRRSEEAKARWADPAYRDRVLAAKNSPDARRRHQEGIVKALASPEVKARQSAAQKEAQNRPEVRAKAAAWRADPQAKKRFIEAVCAAQSRPEVRAKNSARQLIAQNRPEVNAKRSASLKVALSNPAWIQARRERNQDPAVRAMLSAAGKKAGALSKAKAAARRAEREQKESEE